MITSILQKHWSLFNSYMNFYLQSENNFYVTHFVIEHLLNEIVTKNYTKLYWNKCDLNCRTIYIIYYNTIVTHTMFVVLCCFMLLRQHVMSLSCMLLCLCCWQAYVQNCVYSPLILCCILYHFIAIKRYAVQ